MHILLYIVSGYLLHQFLQYLYYENCTHNMFLIMLFKSSDFCLGLKSVLDVIEGGFYSIFKSQDVL